MEGITVLEMAQALGASSDAIKRRLQRKGIKPFRYIGSAGIYKNEDFEAIKDGGKRGEPAKANNALKPKAAKKKAKKK